MQTSGLVAWTLQQSSINSLIASLHTYWVSNWFSSITLPTLHGQHVSPVGTMLLITSQSALSRSSSEESKTSSDPIRFTFLGVVAVCTATVLVATALAVVLAVALLLLGRPILLVPLSALRGLLRLLLLLLAVAALWLLVVAVAACCRSPAAAVTNTDRKGLCG